MSAADITDAGRALEPTVAGGITHNSAVTPPRWYTNPIGWIIICGLILVAVMVAATASLLSNLRNRDLTEKRHVLENLTLVLAEQIDRSFQSIELVQTSEIARMQTLGIASAEDFARQLSGYDVHQRLKAQVSALPYIDAFMLTDAEGNLINFSRSWPIPKVAVPDQDPHELFIANPQLTSLVGNPILSPVTGRWVVPIARKFTGPNDEFLGVMTGVMETQYFEELFRTITNSPGGTIALFRSDSTLLVRYPHQESAIGQPFTQSKFFQALAKSDHGTTQAIGVIDGQERLVGFHSLAHYPVIVVATTAVADALANWKRGAIVMTVAALMIGLVIGGAVFLSIRMVGRKLREQNLQRDAALDNMSQGLVMFNSACRLVVCNDRYRQLYDLPLDLAKPGCTILDLLRYRAANGTFSGNPEEYVRDLRASIGKGETTKRIVETVDGCIMAVVSRPVAGGGWVATHEDITEAKRREALIEESHDNLERAEAMARLGHYRIEPATGEYSCSEGFYRVLGKSPGSFKATLTTVLELIHPDDRPALKQYRRDIISGIQRPPLALRVIKDDGEIIHVEGWSEPLRAGNGAIIGMFGTLQDVTGRKRAEAALAQTNAFFKTVIANMPLMLTVKNASDLNYVLVNPAAEKIFKVSAAEMAGKRARDLIAPDLADLFETRDGDVFNGRKAISFEHIIEDSTGDAREVIATKVPILSDDGEPQYLITLAQDITDRKRAEAALARANRQLIEKQYAIDQAVAVTVTDAMGNITYVNDKFCRISGYSREELVGKTHRILNSGSHSETFFRDMYRTIANGQVWRAEMCNKAKDGSLYWVDTTIVPQLGRDGKPAAYMAIRIDITARKQAETKISYMANHDSLTGLRNRVILNEKLKEVLARSRRTQEAFAVLLLDLDGFKHINDTLGHAAGDELLKELANRLNSSLRETDIVARLGGDEFAIIQSGEKNQREAAITLALRVLEIVCMPIKLDGRDVIVGTSIGIAVAPEDGSTPGELLQNADLALYRAKSEGRNNFRFFDEEMSRGAVARLRLLNDLRAALDRHEFEMHYQPIFDVKTSRPCSVEALVRWRHPAEGCISPDRFIPLAEEAGLMESLGGWILGKACADAMNWPDNVKIAVNLSAIQFRASNLFDVILCALVESELPPERLELEITESVLMQDAERNSAIFQQLKNIGVSIVLDDFGTGYSSLSYLTKYPFDKIKIDKSFTQGLTDNAGCAASVASVLTLARALNMVVTAEGVETKQQFELLRVAGVHQVQGYLFARPSPATELSFIDLEQKGQVVAAA